jgi:hypothetical protein
MLPVATVDCAPAGSRQNVVKLIHRMKANQNLTFLILSSTIMAGLERPGAESKGPEYNRKVNID